LPVKSDIYSNPSSSAAAERIRPARRAIHILLPFSLAVSAVASVVVCLGTPPESGEILQHFYRTVRPWVFWKPVYNKMVLTSPNLQKNTNFTRDAFNVGVGIIWRLTLNIIPICIVIRRYRTLWLSLVVLAVTSVNMKFSWQDKLGTGDMPLQDDTQAA
jgi:hypothetical protein